MQLAAAGAAAATAAAPNVAPLKAGLSMHKMLPFDKRNAAQQVSNLCAGVVAAAAAAAVAAIAVAVAFIIDCSSNSCCMWNALPAVDVRSTMQICASSPTPKLRPIALTCNLLQLSNCLYICIYVCVYKCVRVYVCVCDCAGCQTAFKHDSGKHSSPVSS